MLYMLFFLFKLNEENFYRIANFELLLLHKLYVFFQKTIVVYKILKQFDKSHELLINLSTFELFKYSRIL
jgi:hypothetical protein